MKKAPKKAAKKVAAKKAPKPEFLQIVPVKDGYNIQSPKEDFVLPIIRNHRTIATDYEIHKFIRDLEDFKLAPPNE